MLRIPSRALVAACVAVVLAAVSARAGAAEYPTLDLAGRVHLGYAFYDGDVAVLGNGGEVRRARLGVKGLLVPEWSYGLSVDFAGGDARIKDALIEFSGLTRGTLVMGQFKQPFSLSNLTSANYLTFIERPLPVLALATDRRLGIGYRWAEKNYTFALSGYGQDVATRALDEGLGAGSRFTFAPLNQDGRVVHLGIAGAFEQAPDASETIRFSARPESHVTDVRLVDTGTLDGVENLARFGLEAATVLGPLSVQGEFLTSSVQRDGLPDVTVAGFYVFASYFLTGESRPYKGGVFRRVEPLSDAGAWELALRYSSFDLNDDAVSGGEAQNLTLGVNYYAASHLKFQANYTRVQSERNGLEDDPNILQFRIVFDF